MQRYCNTCNILGVNVSVVNMDRTLAIIRDHLEELKGDYICVSNVHTTVMSYENAEYRKIQNSAAMVLPDGGPLSKIGRTQGYKDMDRVTGPDLMGKIFERSIDRQYRHFFYGATEEVLEVLEQKLRERYPGIVIAGMFSPPFRPTTPQEDETIIQMINHSQPDFVWVGLGAPKQEQWMAEHKGRINGVMLGVGAGFNYHAGKIKRAPMWMQKNNLEWLYRLCQEPKRLFWRYFKTNIKFLYLIFRTRRL